jgi:hypothetical protein
VFELYLPFDIENNCRDGILPGHCVYLSSNMIYIYFFQLSAILLLTNFTTTSSTEFFIVQVLIMDLIFFHALL